MARIYEKKHHSPHKRTAIATAYQKGVPAKAVAAEHGISPHALYAIARRYNNQVSCRSQSGRGGKFKLDDRYIRRILREIDQNPFISSKELIQNCSLPVTEETLVKTLKRRGIQHTQALRRPKLSDTIAQKRLEFAHKHLNKPLEYWKRFVFSDETTIARGQGERQAWVFCRAVRL
jgi:transposase-like protein